MPIKELILKDSNTYDKKLEQMLTQFKELRSELNKKVLPAHLENLINKSVDEINASSLPPKQLLKFIKINQTTILKKIEKELKWVPKNHFRNLLMIIGMTGFGLPIGVFFGSLMNNMGLLGLGMPLGMAIGIFLGMYLDNKALKEGRQLDIELKL